MRVAGADEQAVADLPCVFGRIDVDPAGQVVAVEQVAELRNLSLRRRLVRGGEQRVRAKAEEEGSRGDVSYAGRSIAVDDASTVWFNPAGMTRLKRRWTIAPVAPSSPIDSITPTGVDQRVGAASDRISGGKRRPSSPVPL